MLKKLIPFLAILLLSTTAVARPQQTHSIEKVPSPASFGGFKIGQTSSEAKRVCTSLGYGIKTPETSEEFKKQAGDNGLAPLMCAPEPGSEVFQASVFAKPINIAIVLKDDRVRGIDLTYLTEPAATTGIQSLVLNGEEVGITKLPDGESATVYYNGAEEWIGYHSQMTAKNGLVIWTIRVLHKVLHEIE